MEKKEKKSYIPHVKRCIWWSSVALGSMWKLRGAEIGLLTGEMDWVALLEGHL